MAVSFSAEGTLGFITLDNPPANSYDIEFMGELSEAITAAHDDADARVVVLRSANEKFFSAGADVKRFLASDLEANMDMIRLAHDTLPASRARRSFTSPTLPAMRSAAVWRWLWRAISATRPRAATGSARRR